MSKRVVPYGSWPSPLSAARVTAGALRLDQIQLDAGDVYWVEGRASEGGRNVIVKRNAGGQIEDVTPEGFNARSRVHEYGGAAYTVDRGTVYFSNFSDQRIYRQQKSRAPVAITDAGPFFADYRADVSRDRLIAVRETHTPGSEAKNDIVAIGIPTGVPLLTLIEGADFYSDPIVSPDGKFLAWLQWHHPNMPWDGTELWVAAFNPDGTLGVRHKVAGGSDESIFQPEWSPDNALYFVSDRTGWWNLYRWRGLDVEPIHEMAAEFGKPQWTFSMSTYAFVSATRIAATYVEDGQWRLAMIDTDLHRFEPIGLSLEPVESIKASGGAIYFIGASPSKAPAIVEMIDPLAGGGANWNREEQARDGRGLPDVRGHNEKLVATDPRRLTVIRSSVTDPISPEWISRPRTTTFTTGAHDVHAFYYPPTNPDVVAPADDRPPLIVITHGGPTGATTDVLDPKIQFWTSRGFAVLDVNYSGSTGYGRPYRDRLKGQWGIADVADVIAFAQGMVTLGKADGNRLIIRGGSAGGYTTLAALTFHDMFKAGASYYGICDLEVLQHDTHKFESRYNDSLIGPYPAARDVYIARSPIHFTDRLSCPIILFQGLDDKVVPPNQSAMMADAVRKKGLKVKYVTFEGEQHGFRKAENIIRCLEEELAFYQDVFGMPS